MRKVKVHIARVMLSLSLFLIALGIFLNIADLSPIQNPADDILVVSDNPQETISINTIDQEQPNDSETDSRSESSSNSSTTGESHSTVPNSNAGSNSSSGSNSNVDSNSNGSQPQINISSENAKLRQRIESTYGVRVRYGSETDGYRVGGLGTIAISDPALVQKALQNLSDEMSLYPKDFFSEIQGIGFTLTIYLIQRYSSENVTGVTDSSTKNVVMSIATEYSFAESFHHEVYHYIDDYIYAKGGRYTTWNSLNPLGFSYGTVNGDYSYSRTFSENAFFVNNYAQTDEYEDRASTFEYMMADSKVSCLNYGTNIWLKAKYMCEQLDVFFTSVRPAITEYWERFVY